MKLILMMLTTIWSWLLLGLFMLLVFPISLLLLPLPQRHRTPILGRTWGIFSWIFLRFGLFCRIKRIDLRPAHEKKLVGLYVANHQSNLDIPLMAIYHPFAPVMKKQLAQIPLFGFLARAGGAIPVDRSSSGNRKQVFRTMARRLEEGIPVQLYPEGTRSRDGRPMPLEKLKRALIDYCYKKDVPVVPITIKGTFEASHGACFLPFKKLEFTTHPAVYPGSQHDKDDFLKSVWSKVSQEKYS